jgi:hypothetical protein
MAMSSIGSKVNIRDVASARYIIVDEVTSERVAMTIPFLLAG